MQCREPQSVKKCGTQELRFTNAKTCCTRCQFSTCVFKKKKSARWVYLLAGSKAEGFWKFTKIKLLSWVGPVLKRLVALSELWWEALGLTKKTAIVFGLDKAPNQKKRLLSYCTKTSITWLKREPSRFFFSDETKTIANYKYIANVSQLKHIAILIQLSGGHSWWISVEDNNETEKKYGDLVYQIEILTTTHIPLTDQINRLLQKHLPLAVFVG